MYFFCVFIVFLTTMMYNIITMLEEKQETDREEPQIELLRELLSKLSVEKRAYIRGASEALIHAQEISPDGFNQTDTEETPS